MNVSLAISVLFGLLLAAVVYLIGTAITSFESEDLVWGLVAILVFLAVAFGNHTRGRRVL